MHRQGYDLQLTRYDEKGWRATFYMTGMEHSPTSATGTGWERTPWHATRRAAWLTWVTRSTSSVPPLSVSSRLGRLSHANYWPPPLPQSRKSTWTRYDAAGTTGAVK
jgi:hypothetical protein